MATHAEASLLSAEGVRLVLQRMQEKVAAAPTHPLDHLTTQLPDESFTIVLQPNRTLRYLLHQRSCHCHLSTKQAWFLTLLRSARAILADPQRLSRCRRALGSAWPTIPPLPDTPAVFDFRQESDGCHAHAEPRCRRVPTLVIAHSPDRNHTGGILSPNPYFKSLSNWSAAVGPVLSAARQRPINERAVLNWKALWRGGLHWAALPSDAPTSQPGTFQRLAAAALSARYPKLFDIRIRKDWLLKVKPERGFNDPDVRRILDPTSAAFARASYKVTESIDFEAYTQSPALVNLPGAARGSYSRNLNHLWAAGAVVLLWNGEGSKADFAGAHYREWYYDALHNGTTHLELNRASAPPVVAQLLAPTAEAAARRSALAEAAAKVHHTFLCPCCLAAFYSHLLNAIAKAQRSWAGTRELEKRMDAYVRAVGGKVKHV